MRGLASLFWNRRAHLPILWRMSLCPGLPDAPSGPFPCHGTGFCEPEVHSLGQSPTWNRRGRARMFSTERAFFISQGCAWAGASGALGAQSRGWGDVGERAAMKAPLGAGGGPGNEAQS